MLICAQRFYCHKVQSTPDKRYTKARVPSVLVYLMVFNPTFSNSWIILWWFILLVEETWGTRENLQPAASHWQTLSHNVVLLAWAGVESTTSVVMGTQYPIRREQSKQSKVNEVHIGQRQCREPKSEDNAKYQILSFRL